MPILEIQTRVEDGQITYLFYKKDVAIPLLLRASSAMPQKMKRTALIQEAAEDKEGIAMENKSEHFIRIFA